MKQYITKNLDKYILLRFPESQDIMDQDWFNECFLADDIDMFGSSAYFVPEERYKEFTNFNNLKFRKVNKLSKKRK